MNIIRRNTFVTVPWNNGGGITHEVRKLEKDGKLLWRLSLAEVGCDGPFSLFPGLARILTVIEGEGMDLVTPAGALAYPLPLLQPVHFPGEESLVGRLRAGPCLDFNLIYDPALFKGEAAILSGKDTLKPAAAAVDGVLCLEGTALCGEHTLHRHDFAFLAPGDPPLSPSVDGKVLRLMLRPKST